MVRVTIQEASTLLGVKEPAIRARIRRGTLHSTKDDSGRVWVEIPDEVTHDTPRDTSEVAQMQAHIDSLREQLEHMRQEAQRRDAIIMSLTQRIPELEAPRDERDAPERATEDTARGVGRDDDTDEPRSWWRRFFGW